MSAFIIGVLIVWVVALLWLCIQLVLYLLSDPEPPVDPDRSLDPPDYDPDTYYVDPEEGRDYSDGWREESSGPR